MAFEADLRTGGLPVLHADRHPKTLAEAHQQGVGDIFAELARSLAVPAQGIHAFRPCTAFCYNVCYFVAVLVY